MSFTEYLLAGRDGLPAPFQAGKDGTFTCEVLVAQRKGFLSRKKLVYRCRLGINEAEKRVKIYETLKETGWGLSAGGSDDSGPGMGFKKEVYSLHGAEREGTIEEQSHLFGQKYQYSFDFSGVRGALQRLAATQGYALEVCLREKSLYSR